MAGHCVSKQIGRHDAACQGCPRCVSRSPEAHCFRFLARAVRVSQPVGFPALDMILAIAFFVKLGGAYFDFRQRGQFEGTGPAILFACLIFTLTAPKYIWSIIGI